MVIDIDFPPMAAPSATVEVSDRLGWTLYPSVESAGAIWRRFELEAIHSPFQRQSWCGAYASACLRPGRDRLAIVELTKVDGAAVALLPLAVRRRGPLAIASFIGGEHASFHMPLFKREHGSVDRRMLMRALAEIGDREAIDVFHFTNQPSAWRDHPNPLASLFSSPSAEPVYTLGLEGDCDAVVRSRLSKDALGKLRRKEKRLAELGPVTLRQARTPADADAMLDFFLAQKAARFRQMGVPDPFAERGVVAFLRAALRDGLEAGNPAVELHGLMAGERILAVYGAAVDADRFCGMFTAFDLDADVARWSPGDQLLLGLIRAMCHRGLAVFDLGVGDARYKRTYCDGIEPLHETVIAATAAGLAGAALIDFSGRLKRRIKENSRLYGALNRFRRLSGRFG